MAMKIIFLFGVVSLCCALRASAASDGILVEAEMFRKHGGWVVDPQFMDQMGSPYLLAHGLGKPVADAQTGVGVAAAGTYRLWVRTMDWVARWQAPGALGRFQVVVNGSAVREIFGTQGAQWHWHDGGTLELPVGEAAWFQNRGAAHVPEIIYDLPEGYSIMNESGMTTDSAGRPIIANWWADGAGTNNHTRQYHILYRDESGWHRRTLSARDIDNPATKYAESQLSTSRMGRPVVLTDAADRIIVVYNDNRFNGITAVFSQPLAADTNRLNWTRMNITSENLGNWETTYDEERWRQDGVLQMLYQRLPGMGASYSDQNNATPVSVVEWNARAYFCNRDILELDTVTTPGAAALSTRTRTGFRYNLKTGTSLEFSEPPVSEVSGDNSRRTLGSWPMNEPRRFWLLERVGEATNEL